VEEGASEPEFEEAALENFEPGFCPVQEKGLVWVLAPKPVVGGADLEVLGLIVVVPVVVEDLVVGRYLLPRIALAQLDFWQRLLGD